MPAQKYIKSLFLLSFATSAALAASSIEDQSLKIKDPNQALQVSWPNLSEKPSKAVKACVKDLFEKSGMKDEVKFLYDSKFMGFCRFNEYRLSMYQGCVAKLTGEIKAMMPDTIASFCNHAPGFSKNDYSNYTDCLSKVYSATDLYGGFVSSVCETSKGRKEVVECLVKNVGRGKETHEQLQILDDCMKL